MERPAGNSPSYLPVLASFVLAAILNFFALPIVWFVGSRENRAHRLTGFYMGVVVNFGIVVPFLVILFPEG